MNTLFLISNGFIGFFSDIILNILSRYKTGNIKTLDGELLNWNMKHIQTFCISCALKIIQILRFIFDGQK